MATMPSRRKTPCHRSARGLAPGRPDTTVEGGLPRGSFYLGMPHLTQAGLSPSWPLRECGHGHGWALALRWGKMPSELREAAGARTAPAVICCTLPRALDAFREDDVAEFRRTVWPGPETGWRSETVLTSHTGAIATGEPLAILARRDEPPNRCRYRPRWRRARSEQCSDL